MAAMRRATECTRKVFISGVPAEPTGQDLADQRTIDAYLRAAGISLEADADRDRIKLLEFADYGQG